MKQALIVSQAVSKWVIDILTAALPPDTRITCITGSAKIKSISGINVVEAPRYDNTNYRSKTQSWFRFNGFLKKWFRKDQTKYDLIISTSNPPLNSVTIPKYRPGVPYIYIDWDLYPQCLLSHGASLPIRVLYKIWAGINNRYFPKIDSIVTLSESMKESILKDVSTQASVDVIPVSVDVDKIRPVEKSKNLFLKQHGIEDKTIVLYSGSMGYSKNIEVLLETAKMMQDDAAIKFVLIGDGPKYAVAQKLIDTFQLDNVLLLPRQADEIFPYSISCGDVSVIADEIREETISIPSRTFSMLAAGQPIIAITHRKNDLAKLLLENRLGCVIDTADPALLKDAIYRMVNNKEELEQTKRRAREIAVGQYSIACVSRKYAEIIQTLIG